MAAKQISVQEAAVRLGITRQRVVQLIDEGKGELKAEKVGRSWVLRAAVVDAFKERKRQDARDRGTVTFIQKGVAAPDVEAFDLACEKADVARAVAVGNALREYAERLAK